MRAHQDMKDRVTRPAGRRLSRVLGGLLTCAIVGGGLTLAAGASADTAAMAAPADTVTSKAFVSATPSEQSGGCTVDEVRATQRWWMFGHNSQFDFGVKGSANPKTGRSPGVSVEGSTIVTDTQGNLRFWSNGVDVWGADGKPIKNSGDGKGMSSSAQTVVAVPAMGSPGKYYVIMSGYQAEMGAAKASLYYSVIDMNANGGKGEMTQKNIALGTAGVAGEGLTATVNAEGDGFWVYSVAANSNKIHRWEFKDSGPVSKTPISQTMTDTFASYSTIHFDNSRGSNRGVVLASNLNIYTMILVNRQSGALTEGLRVKHIPASGTGQLYGAAFSPSGRYLYFTDIYGAPSRVYRVDLQKKTAPELRDSRREMGTLANDYRSGGAVKLGPDGNIWVNDGYGFSAIGKIANPDAGTPGAIQRVALGGSGALLGWGLPDMVTGCEKRVPQMTATISAPAKLTLGDAIDPVTVTVENTGNTVLTNIAPTQGANTCEKTSLGLGESMTCTVAAGTFGSVTQQQNDAGVVSGVSYQISARGSIGADPATGRDRTAAVTVSPTLDLAVVTTRTMTFDPTLGELSGASVIKRVDGQAWGALPTASAPGKVFLGWHTQKEGGEKITSASVAKGDLTAYAQWRPARYNVIFDGNAETGVVDGSTASATYDSGCTDCRLPANGFTKTTGAPEMIEEGSDEKTEVNSTFLGWSLDPQSRTGDIADKAVAGGLSQTDGATIRLFAIWDDAPRFIVESYPNRFFTLTQAKQGAITEAELLRTVIAKDRETKPLEHKTSEDVEKAGNDVGITVHDYDASDFSALTSFGAVTVTYKVKDEVGNVAFLRIRVTVSDEGPVAPESVQYLRGISSRYADKNPAEGGLQAESQWLLDPTRSEALGRAMSGSNASSYCLDAGAIAELRAEIRNNGLGNSSDPDALGRSAAVLAQRQGSCE